MNPSLDKDVICATFRKEGKVRVKNFLNRDDAGKLLLCLHNDIAYNLTLVSNDKYQSYTEAQWRDMEANKKNTLNHEVMTNAAKGIGFVYGRHAVKADESNELLKRFYDWINSEAVLAWAREVSGFSEIKAASVQATRFMPGEFLTRHQDKVDSEGRKLAFVVNLPPSWHPDWGGLLQFYQTDGTPTESWSPEFNSLSLFDVKHIHSVTYVAPFALQPRYAISGWFTT